MGTRVLLHGKAVCACIPQQFTWVAQGPLNLCTHPSRWSHAIAGYLAILGGETLLRADTGYGYLLDLSGLDDTQRRVAQAGQQVEVHCWQSGPIAPWPPDPGETLHVSQLHPLQPSAPHLDDTTGSMGNSMGTASSWGPAARRLAQAQAPPRTPSTWPGLTSRVLLGAALECLAYKYLRGIPPGEPVRRSTCPDADGKLEGIRGAAQAVVCVPCCHWCLCPLRLLPSLHCIPGRPSLIPTHASHLSAHQPRLPAPKQPPFPLMPHQIFCPDADLLGLPLPCARSWRHSCSRRHCR